MQSVVEQIKDRLPINDVLSSYITVISSGRGYKAKCPFHNERTASLSISPEPGLYYCFGCGAKGDVFTFVQEFEGVDFNGALKILADRAGVELRHTDRRADDVAPVYEFLEKTTLRYQQQLKENPEALRYLASRGVLPETIATFRIGYAPAAWRFVADTCTNEAQRKIAERAGLIKSPDRDEKVQGGQYDRFRGRIMFPLSDSSGRVAGFSGRIFPDTPEGPKYLNSPETEVFQKSRILYGFDRAKFHIKRAKFAILVEGQMDLLLSHQSGFKNTVATSGTAISEQAAEDSHTNLSVLSRLSPHLFLAFDGDAAGQKALSRAAIVALSLGMNPKVVSLPEGSDPADYLAANDAVSWKARLQASQHFIVHQVRAVASRDLSPHMLVQALREEVFPYITRVVSPIERNLYLDVLATELKLDRREVEKEYERFVSGQPRKEDNKDQIVQAIAPEELGIRARFAAFIERFSSSQTTSLRDAAASIEVAGHTLGAIELPAQDRARALAIIERDYGTLSEKELHAVAQELSQKTIDQFFAQVRTHLTRELREAEKKGDDDKILKSLSYLSDLNRRMHERSGKEKS